MKRSNAVRGTASALLVAAGVLTSWAAPAEAQRRQGRPPQAPPAEDPRVVEARQAYDEGRRQFDARNYTEALRRFERAFELRNNAVILVAIANCHEQLNNFRDAVGALERYLRERSNAPDRAAIEQRLAQLRPRAQQQTAAATGASTTSTTGTSTTGAATTAAASTGTTSTTTAGTSATATTGAATTGAATATQTAQPTDGTTGGASGATANTTATGDGATATANTSDAANAATDPATTPAEPAAPPPARGISPAVWVCAGLAAAGVAGGSVLGFLALGEHATYNTAPSREVKDRGELFALTADLAFATAVLSGFVGTVVFLSDRAEAAREQRASTALAPHERSRRALRTRVIPAPLGVTVSF